MKRIQHMTKPAKAQARTARTEDIVQDRTEAMIPALTALFLGAFILLGVGFSNSQAVHDTAHDARHAFAFPCH